LSTFRQCCGSGSGILPFRSGINIPDDISESLEPIFWVKIIKFFNADPDPGSGIFLTLDPGCGMEKIQIRDEYPGCATLLSGMSTVTFKLEGIEDLEVPVVATKS
jgi:hypothetical protein